VGVPDYQTLMAPALRALSDRRPRSAAQVREAVAADLAAAIPAATEVNGSVWVPAPLGGSPAAAGGTTCTSGPATGLGTFTVPPGRLSTQTRVVAQADQCLISAYHQAPPRGYGQARHPSSESPSDFARQSHNVIAKANQIRTTR
jgi:hypothetical protein